MKIRSAAAVWLMAQGAMAFKDTSPFLLFSSARLPDASPYLSSTDDIATARSVQEHVASVLQKCPSDTYIVVNQPGASSADFISGSRTPHLRRMLSGNEDGVRSTQVVGSVVGDVGATQLEVELSKRCNAKIVSFSSHELPSKTADVPQIITINLPSLPLSASERSDALGKHDSYLNAVISSLPSKEFTVMYRTSPPSKQQEYKPANHRSQQQQQLYEMDDSYPGTIHANHFKRETNAYPRASNGTNVNSEVPLFEKYNFFSSGIFMGVTVSLLLVSILYVGISAVSSLEVSYMAFSKEMNPSAHKKQQ